MSTIANDSDYSVREVTDKRILERYFRLDNLFLHLYEIGDLDDFFWPHTKWLALQTADGNMKFIALIYTGTDLPVVLAFGESVEHGRRLLQHLTHESILPTTFYSHLSVGLRDELMVTHNADDHGRYWKMGLKSFDKVQSMDTSEAQRLLPSDIDEIKDFYVVHYPGNWFDQRMLASLQTFGIYASSPSSTEADNECTEARTDAPKELVAIAGIHVFSKEYKVASLGNIAVHSDHRGKGLASVVTAALVQSLLEEGIEHIGLNVSSTNPAAIACYTKLGFEKVGEYDEVMWTKKD